MHRGRGVALCSLCLLWGTPAFGQQVLSAQYSPAHMFSASEGVAVRALEGAGGEVVVTADGGATWQATTPLVPLGVTHAELLCFATRQVGYLFGRSGTVLRTADGGQSWQQRGSIAAGDGGRCQFFGGSRGYVVMGSQLLFTSNGGQTWSSAGPENEAVRDTCFSDSLRGVAVGPATAWATKTGGRQWNPVISSGSFRSVACFGQQSFWVGTTDGYVHASTDGGQSWASPVETTVAEVEWAQFVSASVGWVTGPSGQAARTTDGGQSFVTMDLPQDCERPHFVDANVGFSQGQALHVTQDAGVSWTTNDPEYLPEAPEAASQIALTEPIADDSEEDPTEGALGPLNLDELPLGVRQGLEGLLPPPPER